MSIISKKWLRSKSELKLWNIGILVCVTAILLLFGSGYLVFNFQQKQEAGGKQASVIPSASVITADGYLEPSSEDILISPPFTMDRTLVKELRVKRGDRVKAGDIIAVLDSNLSMQAALQNAIAQEQAASEQLKLVKAGAKKGEIEAQRARVSESKAQLYGQIATQKAEIATLEAQLAGEQKSQTETVERIEIELNKAHKDCNRYHSLYRDGAVPTSQMESVCLVKDTSQKSLAEAKATLKRIVDSRQEEIIRAKENLSLTIATVRRQIEQSKATFHATAEVRPVNIAIAEAQLKVAKTAVKQAQVNLDLTFVRSPIDGQILEIHAWPGESANGGIVEIGSTKRMVAVAEVYETDIGMVKLGQKVEIKSSGLSQPLYGTVHEIGFKVGQKEVLSDDPVIAVDARVVKVRVLLNKQSSQKASKLTNLKVDVFIKR